MAEKLLVSKDKRLIEATYSLDINELRFILACISQINSTKSIDDFTEFYVTADQYSEIYSVSRQTALNVLNNIANTLLEKWSTINNPIDGTPHKIRWISKIIKNKGVGETGVIFHPEIAPYLTNFNYAFASYNLQNISKINSIHAIRIYELVIQFKKIKKRVISIELLKKILQLDEKYARFEDFKKKVLFKAIDKINKFSDIDLTVDYPKNINTRSKIVFTFDFKPCDFSKCKKKTITKNLLNRFRKQGESDQDVANRLVNTGKYKHTEKIKKTPITLTNKIIDREKLANEERHETAQRLVDSGKYKHAKNIKKLDDRVVLTTEIITKNQLNGETRTETAKRLRNTGCYQNAPNFEQSHTEQFNIELPDEDLSYIFGNIDIDENVNNGLVIDGELVDSNYDKDDSLRHFESSIFVDDSLPF